MTDVVSTDKRSQMMSAIKAKDTKPELLIRKELHKLGYRYRINVKTLPGKPDIVISKYNAVIFIHGCFWHRHDCHLFKWPATHEDFWKKKITRNHEVDVLSKNRLLAEGWRVGIIWECALKGKTKRPLDMIINSVESWLIGQNSVWEFV